MIAAKQKGFNRKWTAINYAYTVYTKSMNMVRYVYTSMVNARINTLTIYKKKCIIFKIIAKILYQ